ncbi:MAG TPA: hypothetical protein VLW50_01080 [Streptosporangiaceae bacterium]|nr:hypothetical protein [Streptosporangiaceae bacterium]
MAGTLGAPASAGSPVDIGPVRPRARRLRGQTPATSPGVVSGSNRSSGVHDRAVHSASSVVSLSWDGCLVNSADTGLLRNSFKYASKKDWAQVTKDLKPVYTAASEAGLDRSRSWQWGVTGGFLVREVWDLL